MQELRIVLIVVGVLAIAALLFHGLWSSKKDGKAKFGNKPFSKLDVENSSEQDKKAQMSRREVDDDVETIRKERKEPGFGPSNEFEQSLAVDPLIDDMAETKLKESDRVEEEEIPAFSAKTADNDIVASYSEASMDTVKNEPVIEALAESPVILGEDLQSSHRMEEPEKPKAEPEMQVIVLNVHCAGEAPFVGTKLFDSMQQNGLIYGEMNIFHRHIDLSGNGKVLFSVANMMQPGTLEHDDPAEFTTQGISFFMTLPCYGEADQNFNLMLRIAQQIADDMGGNVLDDQRNLMTPDRLASYRRQIADFNAALS
ncbi:cell division protein ZipA [Vibrio sagamiensis]|uniref:Cell division protein ZipA n=1 Tax=Vibrio sagamiensis NBRC 104589 TaxID=1219064 RepID=A0A511QBN2_9VIBR|nr:cell division protein ZipA [Vibrio sagamiensis]PNQ58958.1 cell division protein ZipA [Vibrio agarivorans]GEM74705.1 cell division protein ZipA [Vibrio sagamiensis NBRC 104589]